MNKAVFLDRDGVINFDRDHVHKIEDFKFIPGVIPALKKLSKTDYKLIIVTNQAGIGKGMYKKRDYYKLNKQMLNYLKNKNIKINATYFCPHHPDDGCKCRKPKTFLFEKAKDKFNLDFRRCWLVGDKTSDIKAGKNINCKTILVKTGYAGKDKRYKVKPDFKAKDLNDAVNLILRKEG